MSVCGKCGASIDTVGIPDHPKGTLCGACAINSPQTTGAMTAPYGRCRVCHKELGNDPRELLTMICGSCRSGGGIPGAVYGWCPRRGAPGISRERRLNGDDTCANGCRYPSGEALNTPAGAPVAARNGGAGQVCVKCGKELSGKDGMLVCAACGSASSFRLETMERCRLSDEDFARRRKENAEFLERQRAMQEEHKAWILELDAKRAAEAEAATDARLRRDQLHRLYTMFLADALSKTDGPDDHEVPSSVLMLAAREAQTFFDKEVAK